MVTSTYVGLEATAASADAGITATGINVIYAPDDCFSSYITVSGLDPTRDGHDIEVTAPDGSHEDSDYAYGTSTENFSTLLCTYSEPPGVYTIRVDNAAVGSFSVTRPALSVSRVNKRTVRTVLSLNGAPRANGSAVVFCKNHHRCAQYWRFSCDDFVYSTSFKLYEGRRNGREIASSTTGSLAGAVR